MTVEDVLFTLLQRIIARITSEVKDESRVLCGLTPKPSATIHEIGDLLSAARRTVSYFLLVSIFFRKE